MSQAATINTDDYMRDACGNLIAKENVKDIDLARHALVREIALKAKDVSAAIAEFKNDAMGDIDAFVDLSIERYDVKLGGKKGNVTLDTFDGQYRIERQISEHLSFDEGLQAAKALIDECLREWTQGGNANVRTLVDHAFRVDKKGKLNTGAILALRRLKIDDERWNRAMTAISDSIKVTGSCVYVRVYERDINGKYNLIPLDMAAL